MGDKKGHRTEIVFLLCGVVLTIIFIMLGYWITAILDLMMNNSVDFITGVWIVMDKPFDKYFNNLTPVGVVLGFILAEILFFFILKKCKGKEECFGGNEFEPDIIDVAYKAEIDYMDDKKASNPSDGELFSKDLDSDLKKISDDKPVDYVLPGTNDNLGVEETQEDLTFDDKIVTDLLNDYDLSQIAAMLQIKKYIDIDNVMLLRKMFKPSMPAEDITSYIKMFYE